MVVNTLGFGKQRLIAEIIKQSYNVADPNSIKLGMNDILYIIQEMQDNAGRKYIEGHKKLGGSFQVFNNFAYHLLYRNLANYDSMLLVTSEKGTGKSSFAIMLARAWCQLLGMRFDPKRHLAYSNRDVMNKVDNLNKFEPLVCLTSDTKIKIKHNNKEYEERIDKLIDMQDYQVLTYNIEQYKFEYKKPERTILTKQKADVYELILENNLKILQTNLKIKCTNDHRFLTTHGYLPLHKLNDTDIIYTEYNNISVLYKIKSIKKLEQKEDVYDIIGVEDNHNFVANNMVVHNCDLFGRGIGAIFVKDRNPVNDPWRLKDFRNVGSYTEFTKVTDIEKKLRKHPNFWQMIKFPKPPAWLYNKYLEVREHNVYDEDVVREMITTEDVHKALLLLALQDIMMNDSTLDLNRIGLHIKNTYDVPIAKKNIQEIMRDSKQLIYKIREEQIGVK